MGIIYYTKYYFQTLWLPVLLLACTQPSLRRLLAPAKCPLSSRPPSEMISFSSAIPTWPRTEDRAAVSSGTLATSTPPSRGVLVVPSHVFPVSPVPVLTDPARVLSVTCAVRVACSLPSRSGESGRERLTPTRRETLLPQLSLLLLAVLSSWPVVTRLMMCPSSLLSSTASTLRRPPSSSSASTTSVSVVTSPALAPPRSSDLDPERCATAALSSDVVL